MRILYAQYSPGAHQVLWAQRQQQSVHCLRDVDAQLVRQFKHFGIRGKCDSGHGCVIQLQHQFLQAEENFKRTRFGWLFPALDASWTALPCWLRFVVVWEGGAVRFLPISIERKVLLVIAPKTKIMTAFILAIAFFGIVLADRGADNGR